MWKHFLLFFCVVAFPSYGQEVTDDLNTTTQTSERFESNKEWNLLFRGTAGIQISVFEAYAYGAGLPANVEIGCKQVGRNLPCRNHYRNNDIVNNWSGISDVKFVLYKNDVKVQQVTFDGYNSTFLSWFGQARIKETSWSGDMKTSSSNYFSIEGHQDIDVRRAFFMSQSYGTCPNDFGWFVALDGDQGACLWEEQPSYPNFRYSPLDTRINWNDGRVTSADYFGIFVRYYNQ